MNKKMMKTKMTAFMTILTFVSVVFNAAVVALAYFSTKHNRDAESTLDVNVLFDRLDASVSPTGAWGTTNNPYVINEAKHLRNLYVLQNTYDRNLINENSFFQISTEFGDPVYIGGSSASSLLEVTSIGTEDFPFVSTLRGVQTTNSAKFITLPTGEKSDTSTLGDIRVVAKENQVDIGLFGNVGPTSAVGDLLPAGQTIGSISNLLLYNVQVKSSSYGNNVAGHKYFVTAPAYETNHVGILVGHAQYASLHDISVYYSGNPADVTVKAFDIESGSNGKYTTSGGIVGYYHKIVVDEDTEFPVSSTGTPQAGHGGAGAGLGLGIVYSEDIWTFMEKSTSVGDPAPNNEYNLQQTFGTELYGAGNTAEKYFQVGVFTFAHSKQAQGKDRLAKLWAVSGSNNWTISTSSATGNYTASNQNMGAAKRYVATKILKAQTNANTYGDGDVSFDSTNYRFMFVNEDTAGKAYALLRYGSTAIPQEVNMSNLVIPDGNLEYYTFQPLTSRVANTAYPPYEAGWSFKYQTPGVLQVKKSTRTSPAARLQYAAYGKEIIDGGIIREAPRPLRIYAQNMATTTPTTSFMAAASTTYVEGIRVEPDIAGNFTKYKLIRTGSNGGADSSGWYVTFSPQNGFSATDTSSQGTFFSLYAVRITNNASKPSENPVATTYQTVLNTPDPTKATKTYDMQTTALFYTGTPTSQDNAVKYKYDVRSIESLQWPDNNGDAITEVSKVLKMADPTSYYNISNRFWGVTEDIPSPTGGDPINVPEGSIGFTVNGTGQAGDTAKVFVMVATDPAQGVDQMITISRFGTNNNQNGDRAIVGTFVLPPSPANTTLGTNPSVPIKLTDNGNNYTAYPNYNTLIVAYEFTVPARYNITYFLEASRGSARFVYLSTERTVAQDNNPSHKDDVRFPPLNSIDFVFKGIVDTTRIATVGSSEYVTSLTSPYFGVAPNPSNPKGENPAVDAIIIPISTGFNFTYSIGRTYDAGQERFVIYINVTANVNGSGYTPPVSLNDLKVIEQNMNFNFSEWSYLDAPNYRFVYSDILMMTVNGYAITDWNVIS